jgi:predicted AAA+ superfamily ATPase
LSIRLSDQIEQLDELITAEGDGTAFCERTHIPQGMQDLISEGLARLAGASSQAVFHLKQAMGGGKTHLLVGFGLLTRTPKPPQDALRRVAARIDLRERQHRRLQRAQQPRPLLLGRDRQPARQG